MFWPQLASAVPHWSLTVITDLSPGALCRRCLRFHPLYLKGFVQLSAAASLQKAGTGAGWLGNAGKRGLAGSSLHISHFKRFRCLSVSFYFHLLYPQVHDTLVLQFTQSLWTDEHLMGILSKYNLLHAWCRPGTWTSVLMFWWTHWSPTACAPEIEDPLFTPFNQN